MKKMLISVMIATCLLWASCVFAIPTLQLDISNAVYDDGPDVKTVISTGDSFTLYALLNRPGDYSGDFYISAAVTPAFSAPLSPKPDLGAFTFAGQEILVTDGMVWGTPPLDQAKNDDLSGHGAFPTYFKVFEFFFDNNTVDAYDVEAFYTDPNYVGPSEGYLYSKAFEVDVSGLVDGYEIHFDLYNLNADGSVDQNAPFSHDAQSGAIPAPEPSTLLLLGAGLVGFGAYHQRRGKG